VGGVQDKQKNASEAQLDEVKDKFKVSEKKTPRLR
jgi:hypothetical protein